MSINFVEGGESPFPDLEAKQAAGAQVVDTSHICVALDPHGMQSGKPSACFRFDLNDGNVVLAYTSIQQLQNLMGVIRGRLLFLGLDEEGRPLKTPDRSQN